ncbi:MAG: helix-turn-helix transcriptional regulator [Inquilinus sp.]|uniref:helix-turn-helix transcriptional regulator n=1 Tax=Bacteria TaxID=2 RepID=UPI00110FAAF0|nr:YafY family protein [Mycobacterium sp. KBS0706]TSD89168.1 YafY family transcriptional regulator [Mycobacterium sp. KBS0706]
MRRADRLIQILLFMRGRTLVTAQQLSEALEVSERTIYRDMADLLASGTPIDGEAGVGYRLRRGFEPPPVQFTAEELLALSLGARMVAAWTDPALARAAGNAARKISGVLPEASAASLDEAPIHAPSRRPYPLELMEPIRLAIAGRRKLRLHYSAPEATSERIVHPLGLFFWGNRWTATAWCELRQDFRSFRLDRIDTLETLEERFQPVSGRTLEDYLNREREWREAEELKEARPRSVP